MPFLLDLSATLAVGFTVLLAVLKFSGAAPALEPPCRVGLIAAGLAWLCLAYSDSTGSPLPPWLYPLLLALVLGGPKLARGLRQALSNRAIKRRKNWRCPSCGKENEGIAAVCYFCQAWNKT